MANHFSSNISGGGRRPVTGAAGGGSLVMRLMKLLRKDFLRGFKRCRSPRLSSPAKTPLQ